MKHTKDSRNKKSDNKSKEANRSIEEVKLNLEKQLAAAVWIQTFGIIAEAILLLKISSLNEETSVGDREIVTGVWIQTIGQILEAVGVSQQVSTTTRENMIKGQRIATTGDWLQSIGAAIEAVGGEKVLVEEQLTARTDFVP